VYCGLDGAGGITAGCLFWAESFDGCAGCFEMRDPIVRWTGERMPKSFGQCMRRVSTAILCTASDVATSCLAYSLLAWGRDHSLSQAWGEPR